MASGLSYSFGQALRMAVADVQRNGWRCFAPAILVHWCGHVSEVIPIPDAEGCATWCWRLARRRAKGA